MDAQRRVAGRDFDCQEIAMICEVVQTCSGLSRVELARTVCELIDWKRANGGLKARECRDLLDGLEADGFFALPRRRPGRQRGSHVPIPVTDAGDPACPVVGTVRDLGEVLVQRVENRQDGRLFRELVGRHHYLGYRVPFGAQLRYLVWASKPHRQAIAAVQYSSPAWRLLSRDRWIGWDDDVRRRNLQRVVNQSRLLILPWVQVKNLCSRVLSLATRILSNDWHRAYGVKPLLVETLVDRRYQGTCYRAANWIRLGWTSGRGRADAKHERCGQSPKAVFVFPLVRDAGRQLRETY